MLKVKFKLSIP